LGEHDQVDLAIVVHVGGEYLSGLLDFGDIVSPEFRRRRKERESQGGE
jgi:hypothetical protein